MLYFECDYNRGAHEKVMQRLVQTNLEGLCGYGEDAYCESAKEKIKKQCECPEAEVFFLVGGTQTNQVVTSTVLQPYEGVVSASTGHVNTHEAGAIEYCSHKVIELEKEVRLSFWEKKDETHTVVRFATSWATTDEELDALEKLL